MGLFHRLLEKLSFKKTNSEHPSVELLEQTELIPGFSLPKVMAEFWPEISQQKRSFIRIKANLSETVSLRNSSFFHHPCLPAGYPYPTDDKGVPMIPLAQINFSECPNLQGFPATGYLQFYIADNDVYGLNFDNPQDQGGFRVLYFTEDEVVDNEKDFPFLREQFNGEFSPGYEAHQLSFELSEEYLGITDFRGQQFLDTVQKRIQLKHPSVGELLTGRLYEQINNSGHKMSGYAYFTQSDPRDRVPAYHDYILLLQQDSDEHIMWGDVGVANFFIHPTDLASLDFSRVVYNWDCG